MTGAPSTSWSEVTQGCSRASSIRKVMAMHDFCPVSWLHKCQKVPRVWGQTSTWICEALPRTRQAAKPDSSVM